MGKEKIQTSACKSPINTEAMKPIEEISSADIDYLDEVVTLAEEAKTYLSSMPWCKRIVKGWLDFAYGYIIGIFCFQIAPAKPDVPRFVWVIVGDIPPAYLDVEYCPNSKEALEGYVEEMQAWVNRVLEGRPLDDDVIPVNVPPEKQWAEKLQSRLNSVRKLFLGKSGELAKRDRGQKSDR